LNACSNNAQQKGLKLDQQLIAKVERKRERLFSASGDDLEAGRRRWLAETGQNFFSLEGNKALFSSTCLGVIISKSRFDSCCVYPKQSPFSTALVVAVQPPCEEYAGTR
jgi:hypothetical protein